MMTGFSQGPLTLKSYYVPRFFYTMRPGVELDSASAIQLQAEDLRLEITFDKPKQRIWRVDLRARPADSLREFAYHFGIHVVGDFTVSSDFPADQVEEMVHRNAPLLLYSVMRGILASSTERSPYPQILLPLNAVDVSALIEG